MAKRVIQLTEGELKELVEKTTQQVLEEREPLLEMARIDEPHKDAAVLGTKEVWVYGNDRSSMTPHFHYFDKKSKPNFEVEVKIDDLTICKSSQRTGIPLSQLLTWNGITGAKKALDTWLNMPNADAPTLTNYQMLKIAWNQNNRNNQVKV